MKKRAVLEKIAAFTASPKINAARSLGQLGYCIKPEEIIDQSRASSVCCSAASNKVFRILIESSTSRTSGAATALQAFSAALRSQVEFTARYFPAGQDDDTKRSRRHTEFTPERDWTEPQVLRDAALVVLQAKPVHLDKEHAKIDVLQLSGRSKLSPGGDRSGGYWVVIRVEKIQYEGPGRGGYGAAIDATKSKGACLARSPHDDRYPVRVGNAGNKRRSIARGMSIARGGEHRRSPTRVSEQPLAGVHAEKNEQYALGANRLTRTAAVWVGVDVGVAAQRRRKLRLSAHGHLAQGGHGSAVNADGVKPIDLDGDTEVEGPLRGDVAFADQRHRVGVGRPYPILREDAGSKRVEAALGCRENEQQIDHHADRTHKLYWSEDGMVKLRESTPAPCCAANRRQNNGPGAAVNSSRKRGVPGEIQRLHGGYRRYRRGRTRQCSSVDSDVDSDQRNVLGKYTHSSKRTSSELEKKDST
ncbi:hypothetical protein C8R45DRAFT_943408 [Mycena sanguinolenta]|nr:hypothetical protein C8R45DRAFT_943408 [Mycena sanguinolenta]